MTPQELVEYLRMFVTIKKKFSEKFGGQDEKVAAYNMVLEELAALDGAIAKQAAGL